MSSGAGMVANLIFCHPDLFTGAALHSGLPYKPNRGLTDIHRVITEGPSYAREDLAHYGKACLKNSNKPSILKSVVLFHGSEDQRNILMNSTALYHQLHDAFKPEDFNQLLENNDYPPSIVQQRNSPYSYTLKQYKTHNLSVDYYIVHGMGHAWSGGKETFPNTDPRGPDATKIILQTFRL
jgi:poly(3-hydroxybutyrate) depolymerase